jgi:type VI secretion system protein ImpM
MRCGLYGKLAARRDFVALHASRSFLDAWEPWLERGLSTSRAELGSAWTDTFLTAPIWRFWLGKDICGTAVAGAMMPSVDGVGRHYPLAVIVQAEDGDAIISPDIDSQDGWFESAEALLLATLETTTTLEQVAEALGRLRPPAAASPEGLARARDREGLYAAVSFWWTAGGGTSSATAFCRRGMPDANLFAPMLSGAA